MTEREAWLALADAFDSVHLFDGEVYVAFGFQKAYGLCGVITLYPDLTDEQRATMFAKVALPDGSYRWPLTLEGAEQRAAFCREQAERL